MRSKNNELFFFQKEEVVFLLIDVQESLMKTIQERKIIEINMKLLLHLSKIINIPVIVTTQNAEKLGPTIDSLAKLLPENQNIYNKLVFSCLRLEPVLEEIQDKRTLVLFGIEAHICVFQTAMHALSKGYNVIVVNDAVSSRVDSNKKAGLERLKESGAMLYSTEMIIYELLGEAGTDNFRAMLPYLKEPNKA